MNARRALAHLRLELDAPSPGTPADLARAWDLAYDVVRAVRLTLEQYPYHHEQQRRRLHDLQRDYCDVIPLLLRLQDEDDRRTLNRLVSAGFDLLRSLVNNAEGILWEAGEIFEDAEVGEY